MNQSTAAISRRVQRLESSILMCIGAGICVAALFISNANATNLAMWAMTYTVDGHPAHYTMSAFGTLTIFDELSNKTMVWPGLVGNLLPCITIMAGVTLSIIGIKKRKASIVGGLVAIASPLVLVALLLSLNIAFVRDIEPYDVIGIREMFPSPSIQNPNPLAGAASYPPYTWTWGIGISTYLPIAGGIVVFIGIGYGHLARERKGRAIDLSINPASAPEGAGMPRSI